MNAPTRTNGTGASVDLQGLQEIQGVRTVAVHLTPLLAGRLLDRNLHNRKISEKIVQKYVSEINAGEWRLTPGGIGLDDAGTLVDGQHRLHAIVRSQKSVPILITFGLPKASQEKVDRQRRRSLFDVLYLTGVATNRQEVEIATCLTRRMVRSESGVVPSDHLVKQTLECHIDHIRAVIAIMKGANKSKRGLSQASFLAAATLYHEIDSEKCARFLEGVRTGSMLTQDHPAMRLRRFLMGETAMTSMPRGGANQSFIFRRAIYAMQAHLEGRHISGLREAEDFNVAVIPGRETENEAHLHGELQPKARASSAAATGRRPSRRSSTLSSSVVSASLH